MTDAKEIAKLRAEFEALGSEGRQAHEIAAWLEGKNYLAILEALRLAEGVGTAEAALKTIVECDVPREHKTLYRQDGFKSKHDKCPHDRVMYQDCETCISEFASAALSRIQQARSET